MSDKEKKGWEDYYEKAQDWDANPHVRSYEQNRSQFRLIGFFAGLVGLLAIIGGICFVSMIGVETFTVNVKDVVVSSGGALCLVSGLILCGLALLAFIPDGVTR